MIDGAAFEAVDKFYLKFRDLLPFPDLWVVLL